MNARERSYGGGVRLRCCSSDPDLGFLGVALSCLSHQSLKLPLGATGINTDTWCRGEGQMSTVTPGYRGQRPEAAHWAWE